MKNIFWFLLAALLISCQQEEELSEADKIIAQAIEKAGGEKYENAIIEFQFRENFYTSNRKEGLYELTRLRKDSLGEIEDILTNEGIKSIREDREVVMPDSVSTAIAESVNAVHYFVQLPFGLQNDAVITELIGQDTIDNKVYHEIKVTFKQEGGGADHEDVYMYWIEKDELTVDYLAYRFFVNDGGIRFRKAVNPRTVKGIRFVDYENYKTDNLSTPLEDLDDLFRKGQLTKVSQIENEILKVEIQN
ncbi:DUF6503 family protein [Salinimicrobium sp. HB62]|uniref:DUF6503 family protein n=1 Tax=Salinimicrobium sp. HB62 TaxID=3077781 RepID=UPI002D780C95|nr:DUF6503 family protein [Salinimicrobium sp. HB62]